MRNVLSAFCTPGNFLFDCLRVFSMLARVSKNTLFLLLCNLSKLIGAFKTPTKQHKQWRTLLAWKGQLWLAAADLHNLETCEFIPVFARQNWRETGSGVVVHVPGAYEVLADGRKPQPGVGGFLVEAGFLAASASLRGGG